MGTKVAFVFLFGLLGLVLACNQKDTVAPVTLSTASTTATAGTSTTVTSGSAASSTTTSGTATVVKIPDTNFEQALLDLGIDSDKTVNGQISSTDAQKVTSLNIAFKSIADLTGIEGFTHLTALMCGYNKLTTLHVSANTALTKLVCHYNSLSGKLDLKTLSSLTSLDAVGNTNLTSICVSDVSAATANANFLKDATASFSTCP